MSKEFYLVIEQEKKGIIYLLWISKTVFKTNKIVLFLFMILSTCLHIFNEKKEFSIKRNRKSFLEENGTLIGLLT